MQIIYQFLRTLSTQICYIYTINLHLKIINKNFNGIRVINITKIN